MVNHQSPTTYKSTHQTLQSKYKYTTCPIKSNFALTLSTLLVAGRINGVVSK